MGNDADDKLETFDVVVHTIQIMVTMTAWLLLGLIGAVVAAMFGAGVEYVFLTPLVALLIGWVVCMVNVRQRRD